MDTARHRGIVPAMPPSDWSDVPQRLAQLARYRGTRRMGVHLTHRWRLEPPLSEDEVREVETQFQVELPEEYRSFLLQAGSGGAGPDYGLFPLRRVDGRWCWIGDGGELNDPSRLVQPFAHTEAFNPADGLPEPPDEDDYDSVEALNQAEDAYWEHHDAVVFRPEHFAGLLYLSHGGCALRQVLVVNGPARGRMWADFTADDVGLEPLVDADGTPLGFARWYRRWLDEAEAQASREAQS